MTIADRGFMLLYDISRNWIVPLDRKDCAICSKISTNELRGMLRGSAMGFERKGDLSPCQGLGRHSVLPLALNDLNVVIRET